MFEGDEYFAGCVPRNLAEGEGAGAWLTEDGQPVRESYVNLIPDHAGGTHESGLRDRTTTAVKSFIELIPFFAAGVIV
jgi:topoisomerase-4 subunit B